jgi:hypothetical protein
MKLITYLYIVQRVFPKALTILVVSSILRFNYENYMNKLNKYIVPIQVIVYGETEADALEYAQTALDHSDLLDQDGIVGVNSDIEVDDIELFEELW